MTSPLVLIPGLLTDCRVFGPQIESLSSERTLQVVCTAIGETVREIAHLALCTAPVRFALAGQGFGGVIALEMLAQSPERIERLALIGTPVEPLAEMENAETDLLISRVESDGFETVFRDRVLADYSVRGPRRTAIERICREMASSLGAAVFTRQLLANRGRPDQRPVLSGAQCRTMIMCGSGDRIVRHGRPRMADSAPTGSLVEIVDDAAHLPTLEQPERATSAMRSWLSA